MFQYNRILIILIALTFCIPFPSYAEMFMSISGKVIDGGTGVGVAGVDIFLQSVKSHFRRNVTTDSDGNFKFENLPEGEYNFWNWKHVFYNLRKQNYIFDETCENFSKHIFLKKGKNINNVLLRLKKGATISGTIFHEDGITPVNKAIVEIDSIQANPRIITKDVFRTKEDGKFFFTGITDFPNTVKYIQVRSPGYPMSGLKVENVNPGSIQENISIISHYKIPTTIVGKVVDKISRLPQSGAFIELISNDRSCTQFCLGTAYSDEDGNFIIKGLEKTSYLLSVQQNGYYERIISKIEINQNSNNLGEIELYIEEEQKKKVNHVR